MYYNNYILLELPYGLIKAYIVLAVDVSRLIGLYGSFKYMSYRIEEIIKYLDDNDGKYSFHIREYASPQGDYSNEAVVYSRLVSDMMGIIIEIDPFNPTIYYTMPELLVTFRRLEDKAQRMLALLKEASDNFNQNVAGKENN